MTDYYQKKYREFFLQTADIDPSSFLSPFVDAIPHGISMLDVGCGSGRDLLWLNKQGFKVTGFERSAGLADLARKHSGCKVIEGDFETFNFSDLSFDAILASGSLVHVPHDKLSHVLLNILGAFANNPSHDQYMYISMKEGIGMKNDSEIRNFFLWDEATLTSLFADLGFKILSKTKSESVKNSKDLWIGYVLKKTLSPT